MMMKMHRNDIARELRKMRRLFPEPEYRHMIRVLWKESPEWMIELCIQHIEMNKRIFDFAMAARKQQQEFAAGVFE